MRILKCILGAVLLVVGWAIVEVALLAREARTTVAETRTRLIDLSQNANGVLIQAGLVLDNVRQAAETQQASAREVMENSAKASKKAVETLDGVNKLVTKMGQELVPEVTRTVVKTGNTVEILGKEAVFAVRQMEWELTPALRSLAEAGQGAAVTMNDPNIGKSLANVERLTQDAADTMGHVESMGKTADETLKRVTKPGSLVLRGLRMGAEWAWKAITAIGGVK